MMTISLNTPTACKRIEISSIAMPIMHDGLSVMARPVFTDIPLADRTGVLTSRCIGWLMPTVPEFRLHGLQYWSKPGHTGRTPHDHKQA